jgi:hypothetical protein
VPRTCQVAYQSSSLRCTAAKESLKKASRRYSAATFARSMYFLIFSSAFSQVALEWLSGLAGIRSLATARAYRPSAPPFGDVGPPTVLANLDAHEPFDAPLFAVRVGPPGIRRQIAAQCQNRPTDCFFVIHHHLRMIDHILNRDRPVRRSERSVQRQSTSREL